MSRARDLRRDFATVYLAFYSIVVALAAEGLLGRLGELDAIDATALTQAALVLSLAGVGWWIAARWAITLPWTFGFFDVIAPLGMLATFHFIVQSIGRDPHHWLIGVGLASVGAAFIYYVNVRRAVGATAFRELGGAARPAAGLAAVAGLALLGLGALAPAPMTPRTLFGINAGYTVLLVAFVLLEDRSWRRIDAEFERPGDP